MILTGSAIEAAIRDGSIRMWPFNEAQLNPNSYDLRLASDVVVYTSDLLDAAQPAKTSQFSITPAGLVLRPGELYLMRTQEVTTTNKFVPAIEGRSSVGRLGISVHATAGFGDVGFSGTWTLEVSVIRPVRIYAGMRICQIFFHTCTDPTPEAQYKGKYLGQGPPRESRIFQEAEEWLR